MGRKKKMKPGDIVGAIIGFVILGAAITNPWLSIVALIGVGAWGFWKSRSCQICGNSIKRSSYTWTIDGKKKRVCPHCNQQLERQQSRNAFK